MLTPDAGSANWLLPDSAPAPGNRGISRGSVGYRVSGENTRKPCDFGLIPEPANKSGRQAQFGSTKPNIHGLLTGVYWIAGEPTRAANSRLIVPLLRWAVLAAFPGWFVPTDTGASNT